MVGQRPQRAVSKLACLVLSTVRSCRSNICPGHLSTACDIFLNKQAILLTITHVSVVCMSSVWTLFPQLLMCGTGDYSIADLKEHHTVSGAVAEFHKVNKSSLSA